jgi:hypothetical protein
MAPIPNKSKFSGDEFIENGLLLRAVSGPFHTLLADKYWLLSTHISEIRINSSLKVNSKAFFDIMSLIIHLDPHFDAALKYSSTFLASVVRDVDDSNKLCNIAISYDKANIVPYALIISAEMGYRDNEDFSKVMPVVKSAYKNVKTIPDWFAELVVFLRKKENRESIAIQDLKWILKNSKNDSVKEYVRKQLEILEKKYN